MSGANEITLRQKWVNTALLKSDGEVPVNFLMGMPLWARYGKELEKLVERHLWYSPGFDIHTLDFDELAKNPDRLCDCQITDGERKDRL